MQNSIAWLEVFKVVAQLLVGLGWPAAVVLIAYTFRHEIKKKFDDLETAGPTGVTFRPQQGQEAEKLKELQLTASSNSSPVQHAVEEAILADLQAIQDSRRIPILVHQLALARLARHFEEIFWVIFGSQIEALRLLLDTGGKASTAQAEKHFEQVKSQHQDFYASNTFTDWFRYLRESGLVATDGESVSITDMGKEFLVYVAETKAGRTRPF
ncbi:hypothetical protein [Mesorhizobium sp. M0522]|uniref:hypothetical protein n=1 Tax=Mesorhizobium sp. M0522 TaxID=2956958 RepID=UPI00333B17B2